ncbi:MAG: hypothetical protein ACREWG_16090 [Gammaproteobacteria bacterium]
MPCLPEILEQRHRVVEALEVLALIGVPEHCRGLFVRDLDREREPSMPQPTLGRQFQLAWARFPFHTERLQTLIDQACQEPQLATG